MTKTQKLTHLGDRWYGTVVGEGDKQRKRKWLCSALVLVFLGEKPDNVVVTVSDSLVDDGILFHVKRQGYYRWSWRMDDSRIERGMALATEDILSSMFSDDIESHPVWVSVRVK